jgi:hypothetical protein
MTQYAQNNEAAKPGRPHPLRRRADWNAWRKANLDIRPDLQKAASMGRISAGAHLSKANLHKQARRWQTGRALQTLAGMMGGGTVGGSPFSDLRRRDLKHAARRRVGVGFCGSGPRHQETAGGRSTRTGHGSSAQRRHAEERRGRARFAYRPLCPPPPQIPVNHFE